MGGGGDEIGFFYARTLPVHQPRTLSRARCVDCSLQATNFHIPVRHTGCGVIINDFPRVTQMYHRNMAVLAAFGTTEDLANVRSFAFKTNNLYPHLNMPEIVFKVEDNLTDLLEKADSYKAVFKKAVELAKKNTTIFSA